MSINLKTLFHWMTVVLLPGCFGSTQQVERATVGELFTFKIEAAMFNWSRLLANEQFRYTPSLKSYPDLPSWLHYRYSKEHQAGFLYGTAPEHLLGKSITLDIIALNKQNYETRLAELKIMITDRVRAPNVVQMKIDNLNWVHLMDPGRVENLRNIFRKELWLESNNDLTVIFMESAVNMGGRLPLKPQQHEGVIVHLGSLAKFSKRLKELQDEVRPLYKLTTCTFKRTSVQKIFENAGFKLDWCAFKILSRDLDTKVLHHNHDENRLRNGHNNSMDLENLRRRLGEWYGVHSDDIPNRNYIDEFAFAFAIPSVIFCLLFGLLTISLCIKDRKFYNEISYPTTSSTVQMVQYSNSSSQPMTTLKSLKNPKCLLDNTSTRSQSPNNSYPVECPTNTYMRPKPPPYKSATIGRSVNI